MLQLWKAWEDKILFQWKTGSEISSGLVWKRQQHWQKEWNRHLYRSMIFCSLVDGSHCWAECWSRIQAWHVSLTGPEIIFIQYLFQKSIPPSSAKTACAENNRWWQQNDERSRWAPWALIEPSVLISKTGCSLPLHPRHQLNSKYLLDGRWTQISSNPLLKMSTWSYEQKGLY